MVDARISSRDHVADGSPDSPPHVTAARRAVVSTAFVIVPVDVVRVHVVGDASPRPNKLTVPPPVDLDTP